MRNNCSETLTAMYLFLDGELPTDDCSHIQQHLEDCLPCLEAFEFEAELKQMIVNKCREQVPTHLYERIRVSLQAEITNLELSGDKAKSTESDTDSL